LRRAGRKANDMTPSFKVFPGLLDPAELKRVRTRLRIHFNRVGYFPKQSGIPLGRDALVYLFTSVFRLEIVASLELGRNCPISHTHSSYRCQPPTKFRSLAPHQDSAALKGTEGLTFWVPLSPINRLRPTIAFHDKRPGTVLPHIQDDAQYAVLADPRVALTPLYGLAIGDVVMLYHDTIHATHIPRTAVFYRESLDLRAIPQ